jgi:hypothetical protein
MEKRMKQFEIKINGKEVCNYEGSKESPLENLKGCWLIDYKESKIVECQNLTAEIISQTIKEMIYNDTPIHNDELFASNETFLTYSRIEDNEGNHLTEDVYFDCYYATYFIWANEMPQDINFTQIEGITEY